MQHDHDHEAGIQEGSAIWLDRVNEAYYDQLSETMGVRTRERVNWMCAQCEGSTVLDVGCSQGITSILLGREGFQALGIDIMAQAVEYATRELALEPREVQARVSFTRMDLLSMPVGEGYDNVVLGEVVEHQTSATRFLRAARRHVAPGGRMIVTVPFGLHPYPDHKCTVFPRDVVDALDGFSIPVLEVVDGYIRVVAVNDAGVTKIDRDRLIDATQAGAEEAQGVHFEAAAAARKVEARRRELNDKLQEQYERNRKQARDAELAVSSMREELAQLKSQLLVLRNESMIASDEADRLRKQQAATEEKAAQTAQAVQRIAAEKELALAEAAETSARVIEERDQARRNVRDIRLEVVKAAREREALQRRHDRKVEQMMDYRRRLEHQHETLKSWLHDANQELAFIRESVSFRLGLALMSAFRSPRDFVALPVRVGRLISTGLRRRAARRSAPRSSSDPQEVDPSLAWSDPAAIAAGAGARPSGTTGGERSPEAADRRAIEIADVRPVSLASERVPMLPLPDRETLPATPSQPFPDSVAELRVAAIMDDFTRESFRHCCELRQLTPGAWQQELIEFRPHLILVESAWKGENEQWARKIYPLSPELAQMVAWARESGIPTAFWNKEDPVHFSVFLPTARLFDHVFTTDIDCVKGYRAELGHDRVHLLPFACEPKTHNPIETYPRVDGFCFAGSYYVKYPERQRDFSTIVDALRKVSLVDIYDRNHGKGEPSLQFPDVYAPLIRGNLPYDQIDRAYKGYRYGININTVKQSQSMFARRAFDLLASNTITVSNFSRGLRLMFGDLVVSSDDGQEVMRRLEPLLAEEGTYRKFRLQGLRKVMSEHTYEDRLAFVATKLTGRAPTSSLPHIRVIARATDRNQADAILACYMRQLYVRRSLLLVVGGDLNASELAAGEGIEIRSEIEARKIGASDGATFLAVFSPRDYYGPSYLTDLALATRYSTAQVIGKAARFQSTADGAVELQGDGGQYRSATSLPLRAAIVRCDVLGSSSVADLVAAPEAVAAPGFAAFSIDEYNYCGDLVADSCEQADDILLDSGIELAKFQEIAEPKVERRTRAGADVHMFTGYGPHELERLFPAGEYSEGRVRLEPGKDGIAIDSRLAENKFTYVYANAPVPVETLFPGEIGRFNMLVSSDMLLSFTLIFLDGAFKRIGHVIRACNSNQGLVAPEGTRYVMIGFRIQGAGLATLRRLVLQHVPADVDAIAGASRRLLVSRGYPAYDDLYSYAFVHRRVSGYRQSGLAVDVFRLDGSPLAYEEFEGVDIVRGNVGDLALMLDSNEYDSILVHSFDEQVWSALESRLSAGVRVIVWVHGAEIQPWYRRDFNYADDAERRRAIQRSDMRIGLWRRVLEDVPANLHLVFVSEFLARQAMQDLGIEIPRDSYSVIHNVVDGSYFTYEQKPAEQRHRVLSIRPYTKRTYANDLAVKAIVDLAQEPWFEELSFSLFGDGPLFEETVAPLREGFPNVRIERRFLDRAEIRELHREHGVFLVPSRVDSQGVSRDEAMASGLVPVTSRVSAIPEFVDEDVAFLAPAEDWRGLADGIRALHADPERFLKMSANAAAHVRATCGPELTLQREVDLILARSVRARLLVTPRRPRRIAVYGDLNLNVIDGSSVWAASLVQVLAGLPDIVVDLYLKTRLSNTRLLGAVLDLANVRLIEPAQYGEVSAYQPEEAVERIANAHAGNPYEAVVLRGYRLCLAAAREERLRGVLWTYLTDIPQSVDLLDAEWRRGLGEISQAARFMLCQTSALETLLAEVVPTARGRTRRLPPMVPGEANRKDAPPEPSPDRVLRIAYAGKFAPLWGIREMLDAVSALNDLGIACELHVFGDKIHNPPEDPAFRDEIRQRLQDSPSVIWHGGVAREALLGKLPEMDVGWAWRSPELERTTLELSTKVLEYGMSGLPSLMMASPANIEAFGEDYPLFASDPDAIVDLLSRAAVQPELLREAAQRSRAVTDRHTFAAVREHWVANLLPPLEPTTAGVDVGR